MTTTTEPFDPSDPFAVYFHREPLGGQADVLLLVLTDSETVDERTSEKWELGVDWLREQGRRVELTVVSIDRQAPRLHERIQSALDQTTAMIFAISTAHEPPKPDDWRELFPALDEADHVVGRRALTGPAAWWRGAFQVLRRFSWGVPIADVNSPFRLHRTEKLREIPLQSGSSFVFTEVLAKATFLGHLLNEHRIPQRKGWSWNNAWFVDVNRVFKRPTFRKPLESTQETGSRPLEVPERQPESGHSPGGENQQGSENLERPDSSAL